MTMWRSRVLVSVAAAAVLLMVTPEVTAAGQECLEITSDSPGRVEDVAGVWYPMEIVLHRNDSKIYGVPVEAKCPVVTFTPTRGRKGLTMVWNASGSDLTYQLTTKTKGQWQASGEQTGGHNGRLSILVVNESYMIMRNCSTVMHTTIVLQSRPVRDEGVVSQALGDVSRLLRLPKHDGMSLCNAAPTPTLALLATSWAALVLLLQSTIFNAN